MAPPELLVGGGDSPLNGGESSDCEMDESEGHASAGEAEKYVGAGRPSETDGTDDDDAAITSVDPPVKYHGSWEAWQEYFEDYWQRTLQVIPVKYIMSRAQRNKRLKKKKKGEDESQLVPDGYDPYQRTYICTHGWKKRKSRSEGSRPRQHIRLTNCPFRFVVQWNLARGELQVKNSFFWHNHQVFPAAFATYPASRVVMNPLVGARVEGRLAVSAKGSRFSDY